MADKVFKDLRVWIDNAAGTLTEITSHVNSESLTSTMNLLQNTALSDEEHTYLSGVAGATDTINGFWNSTVEGIFGPLIGNRTTKTKTMQLYDGVKYFNGEVWAGNIGRSGSVDTLLTFSADVTFTGAVTRTSKALT